MFLGASYCNIYLFALLYCNIPLQTRVHFKGGVKFSKILTGGRGGGVSHKVRVWQIFFFGLDKKGWGQYFRVGLIPCRALWKVSINIVTKKISIRKGKLVHYGTDVCEFYGISKNTFSYRTPPVATSCNSGISRCLSFKGCGNK